MACDSDLRLLFQGCAHGFTKKNIGEASWRNRVVASICHDVRLDTAFEAKLGDYRPDRLNGFSVQIEYCKLHLLRWENSHERNSERRIRSGSRIQDPNCPSRFCLKRLQNGAVRPPQKEGGSLVFTCATRGLRRRNGQSIVTYGFSLGQALFLPDPKPGNTFENTHEFIDDGGKDAPGPSVV